jgi:hypothetical protein
VDEDRRSFRVALVADRYVNPRNGGLDAMPILLAHDWGVIQLPAARYPNDVAAALLELVAEQAEEFHRHGYDLVVIGNRPGLTRALTAVGIRGLDRIEPTSAAELKSFLRQRRQSKVARRV